MSSGFKDSPEVVEFRMLFARLKDWSDDEPDGLRELAHGDKEIEELGLNVLRAAGSIQKHERLHRDLFTELVDPRFISEWHDFESRFANTLQNIRLDAAADGGGLFFSFYYYEEPDQWVMADYKAMQAAKGLEMTIRFAKARAEETIEAAGPELDWHKINTKGLPPELRQLYEKQAHAALEAEAAFGDVRDQIRNDIASSPDEAHKLKLLDMLFQIESSMTHEENLEEHIEYVARDGWAFWETLKHESGLDLRGILRRRALVPFILFPRHVSARLSSTDLPSIYQNLRQAQEAFVFGVHFAALALMRSVMEKVLRDHYGGTGDLEQCIDSVTSPLKGAANKAALHRLRKLGNGIVHTNAGQVEGLMKINRVAGLIKIEKLDFEREIVSLLFVLRALIEESPQLRSK